MTTPSCPSYAGYRFPAEIISHAVWIYFRFPLSLRMVDELLAARGVVASIGGVDASTPTPVCVQAMRTEFGRPSASMRLRT